MAGVNCGRCGIEIDLREAGIRYFGTFAAHEESRCIQLLRMEIDRLRSLLNTPEIEEFDKAVPEANLAKDCPRCNGTGIEP